MNQPTWEIQIAQLLAELSSVQDELLSMLREKRDRMVANDLEALAAVQVREEELSDRLKSCHAHRQELLAEARMHGLPADSIKELAASIERGGDPALRAQLDRAGAQVRVLQHESLTNWVLAQRTLLHLSQMLEIIATGGRLQPTYGKSETAHSSGSLVDRAA